MAKIFMRVDNFIPWPQDLRGWNGDRRTFKELIDEIDPKIIIEIGSWKGQSTVTMAKACKPDVKIYCIDTWLGSHEFRTNKKLYGGEFDLMELHGYPQVYYQFLSNIVHNGVLDKIEVVPATSENAAPHMPIADLIYVDGQHTYKGVKEDLENFWPKLREGGIMFGDDYVEPTEKRVEDNFQAGVKKAVNEFAGMNNLKVEVRENNFWIIRK
jgi:predicted O-methyltransferase YrrM